MAILTELTRQIIKENANETVVIQELSIHMQQSDDISVKESQSKYIFHSEDEGVFCKNVVIKPDIKLIDGFEWNTLLNN